MGISVVESQERAASRRDDNNPKRPIRVRDLLIRVIGRALCHGGTRSGAQADSSFSIARAYTEVIDILAVSCAGGEAVQHLLWCGVYIRKPDAALGYAGGGQVGDSCGICHLLSFAANLHHLAGVGLD